MGFSSFVFPMGKKCKTMMIREELPEPRWKRASLRDVQYEEAEFLTSQNLKEGGGGAREGLKRFRVADKDDILVIFSSFHHTATATCVPLCFAHSQLLFSVLLSACWYMRAQVNGPCMKHLGFSRPICFHRPVLSYSVNEFGLDRGLWPELLLSYHIFHFIMTGTLSQLTGLIHILFVYIHPNC